MHHPALATQVVQFATTRVDLIEVERVDVAVAVHHFDAEPRLQCPAGTQRVAQKAFLRTDRHVLAKQLTGGQCLGNVALFGGGAVAVYIADGLRANTRVASAG